MMNEDSSVLFQVIGSSILSLVAFPLPLLLAPLPPLPEPTSTPTVITMDPTNQNLNHAISLEVTTPPTNNMSENHSSSSSSPSPALSPSPPPPSRSSSNASDEPAPVSTSSSLFASDLAQDVKTLASRLAVTEVDTTNEYEVTTATDPDTFEWRELETYQPSPALPSSIPVSVPPLFLPSHTVPFVPSIEDVRVSAWDRPQDEEDKDMPPLEEQSSSESQEDSQEDSQEEDSQEDSEEDNYGDNEEDSQEDNEEDEEDNDDNAPAPIIPRSRAYFPPMIPLLGLFLFFLHLFQYGQLLHEKRLREKNPCFLMHF